MKRTALFVLSFPFSQWYDGMLEKKKKQSERHKLQGQYIIGNPMEYLLKTDGRARPQPIFPVTFNQPNQPISPSLGFCLHEFVEKFGEPCHLLLLHGLQLGQT